MIIRKITIITIALNASVVFLANIGSAEVWGIEMSPGIGETVSEVQSVAQNISAGPSGVFDAMVGLVLASITLVVDLLQLPFALPILASNLGVPPEINAFVFGPLYLVVAIDIVAIMRGDSGI